MPTVQHLLETRFSVRMGGHRLTPEWLQSRLELLRRYTLPSVAAQTATSFTWLLYCDESTEPAALEQLRLEERRLDVLRLALTGPERSPLAVARAAVREDADVLITTRLDSDDAIADRYVEAIQAYARAFHRSRHEDLIVNFPRGYRLDAGDGGRLYEDWMPNSSFHSLLERPRRCQPKTVTSGEHANLRRRYADHRHILQGDFGGHARLHQHYATHQDESMPAWLINVHGGNLVNRIPPTAYPLPVGSMPDGFTLAGPYR